MISSSTLGSLFGLFLLISSIPDAASYTKYGRTCKDIGCRSDEVCIMAEDPCSLYQRDNCGRYPTCAKSNQGPSCSSMVCGQNEYCRTENGVPKCVKRTTGNGYESAGVSYINGERVNTNNQEDKGNSNENPYANANAPPAPVDPVHPIGGGGYHQVNSGSNLGYPSYPSTSNNNGYPPYPSSNQGNRMHDLGYPPYPTQNRMPQPGYPPSQGNQGYPNQAGYPPAHGYPQQYPGHQQNYPYPAYPNQNRIYTDSLNSIYRRNNGASITASLTLLFFISLARLAFSRS